ncbi:hypothetical protein SETIT_3G035700v2 [Setaria italica]|uniref:Uncharacterized protein n=1 Tax=Setaria italica TaxID=4555 RepID=A0A368QD20_SETIT|nr:hypothetical protein SETIT_3G035700v2 [Setaria italica]
MPRAAVCVARSEPSVSGRQLEARSSAAAAPAHNSRAGTSLFSASSTWGPRRPGSSLRPRSAMNSDRHPHRLETHEAARLLRPPRRVGRPRAFLAV